MPTLALLLLHTFAPLPIDLDGLSVPRARHLSGRLVVASFVSVKPVVFRQDRRGQWWTAIGARDRDDDADRDAVVRGVRGDLNGRRLLVFRDPVGDLFP